MWPDWESNQTLFGAQDNAQPQKSHWPGPFLVFFNCTNFLSHYYHHLNALLYMKTQTRDTSHLVIHIWRLSKPTKPQSPRSRQLLLFFNKLRVFLFQSCLSGLQKVSRLKYLEFCTALSDNIKIHFSLLDTWQNLSKSIDCSLPQFLLIWAKNSIRWLSKSACSFKIWLKYF